VNALSGGAHSLERNPREWEAETRRILLDRLKFFGTEAMDDLGMLSLHEHDL
jgi:hypothetical protein